MARYAIGDIQGCYSSLMELLHKIDFNPSKDVLYLVGDLVNRGAESLNVLRWAYKNQDSLVAVLGNHDIYLLARYSGIRGADADETVGDILKADDADKLIGWLRSCPLIYQDADYILVHAGIYPVMDFNKLLFVAHAVSQHLQSRDYPTFIESIYGNKPNAWDDRLVFTQQMRFAVNACTRMRCLDKSTNALDYKHKGSLQDQSEVLIPWFKASFHATINKKILFGHWASLDLYQDDKCIGLDTGCVWGRKLTAINLETMELTQVNANANPSWNSG